MNLTAAQTELATQTDTDHLDAMIEEACRLHDEAVALAMQDKRSKRATLPSRPRVV